MSHAAVARELETLMKEVILEGLDPYEPDAASKIAGFAERKNLGNLLRLDRKRLELVDVVRAMHLQRAEHLRQLEEIELVATLPGFARDGFRETSSVMGELIARAQTSILLLAYRLTDQKIIEGLHSYHQRAGTRLKLVVSHEEDLEAIMKNWPSDARVSFVDAAQYVERVDLELTDDRGQRSYPPFHAKTIVVDGRHCYVGSANFTLGGMSRNVEIGLKVDSARVADALWGLVESFPPELLRKWQHP